MPVAAAALRAAARGDEVAVALAAVIAVAAVAGFTKAETERIWLIFVPLACLAAAPVLAARPPSALVRVLGLLAARALAVELLFQTIS